MSTPPPSPSVDHTAIADLQTAAAASTTPALPLRDGAATTLLFSASAKRHSTKDRDGTVSGASSPVKKRVDNRSSPSKRVSIDDNVIIHLPDPSADTLEVNSSFESATTPSIATAIPSVTPSPPTQDEDDGVPNPPTVLRPPAPPKRRKSSTPRIDVKQSRCLTFIRPTVFDTERFKQNDLIVYSPSDISEFDTNYQKQICVNFSQTRSTQKKRFQEARTSRSAATVNLDSVDEGTATYRELSRYILEDLLRCKEGTPFILCLPVTYGDTVSLDLRSIAKEQFRHSSGGEKIKLSGDMFYSFRVTMDLCPLHSEIDSEKGMSQSQFCKLYNDDSGGFRVKFDSLPDTKLMLSWKSVVKSPRELMFFGMPHTSNRPMDYLFYRKTSIQWCHHILRHFSDQYYADTKQSALLLAAYHKARALVYEKREKEAMAREAGLFDNQTLLTEEGRRFVKVFDDHCKYAFYHSITNFQHYNTPIIQYQDWENFLEVAQFVFEQPWRLLMSFRNVRHNDSEDLVNYKK